MRVKAPRSLAMTFRMWLTARWTVTAALVLSAATLRAQAAPQATPAATTHATRASTGWTYDIATRVATPRGALILMPGFGGGFADFSDSGSTGAHRSVLADSLAAHAIVLVFVAPPAGILFGGPAYMQQLEGTLTEALTPLGAAALPLAIGGFSAGGTDAVLFAERCAPRRCAMQHEVRAVFAVDAPLDYLRLWDNAQLVLSDQPRGAVISEAQRIRNALAVRIGTQPTPSSRRYLLASPLASKHRDGGNARQLSGIAVRAYTEPDIQWWMENRNADYYGMNALDAASLIRHLKRLGNTRAELIVTTGQGYRANGMRHPHSWSIVDQRDLARWVVAQLVKP